jgi:adenylate cyclase class 2
MQSAEIELKFPISDLVHLQAVLPALGFVLDTPRTFEQNTLYDTPERSLRESRQLLRIRRYGDLWTLTHKRQPATDPTRSAAPSKYKVRIETETHLDDGEALGAIFEQMGYAPVFRYQKYRTEWSQVTSSIQGPLFSGIPDSLDIPPPNPTCHMVIDETPIGDYAELEGPPAWIDQTLARLNVDPATCLTDSYGRLFLKWKERACSSAENLTFEEIANAQVLQPSLR